MKRTLLVVAIAAVVALMGSPAGAQYDDVFSATISDITVFPGQVVTIEGVCEADDSVSATMGGVDVGSIPVNADGTFSGDVTVPNLSVGDHVATVECGGEVLSTDITVLAADDGTAAPGTGGTGSTGALARTGSSSTDLLVKTGAGLLLAGGAIALVASKRRTAAA